MDSAAGGRCCFGGGGWKVVSDTYSEKTLKQRSNGGAQTLQCRGECGPKAKTRWKGIAGEQTAVHWDSRAQGVRANPRWGADLWRGDLTEWGEQCPPRIHVYLGLEKVTLFGNRALQMEFVKDSCV